MNDYGKAIEPGTVRLERLLPGPIERVWAYLTDPEKRGKWLAPGLMELRVGGNVELRFHHADLSAEKAVPDRYQAQCGGGHVLLGRVTHCDPPRLLSYTWGEGSEQVGEVTFELTPRAGKVLLVVTHRRLPDRPTMVSVASGWHAHIGILIDHLEDREPPGFWSTHARLEAEYEKRLPTGLGCSRIPAATSS